MGPGRSLADLARQYHETPQNAATLSLYTLQAWSKRYGWQERASGYDVGLESLKNERAREIMQTGLSLTHERVDKLKTLAGFLETQIFEQGEDDEYHNVWLPDVKQIGAGEYAERVDIERFNSAIFEQYRGILDDLAKETGGRKEKQGDINVNFFDLDDWKQMAKKNATQMDEAAEAVDG
jgi:hypothetical protein